MMCIHLLMSKCQSRQDVYKRQVLEEGAATLSKEEAGRLAQRQMKFIQNLQAALIRIENKTYGICRETGKLIPKERLRAVPHATSVSYTHLEIIMCGRPCIPYSCIMRLTKAWTWGS